MKNELVSEKTMKLFNRIVSFIKHLWGIFSLQGMEYLLNCCIELYVCKMLNIFIFIAFKWIPCELSFQFTDIWYYIEDRIQI